jgi:hypothetical protein
MNAPFAQTLRLEPHGRTTGTSFAHKKEAQAKKSAALTPERIAKLDLDPDAWPKFEGLVRALAKSDLRSEASRPLRLRKASETKPRSRGFISRGLVIYV